MLVAAADAEALLAAEVGAALDALLMLLLMLMLMLADAEDAEAAETAEDADIELTEVVLVVGAADVVALKVPEAEAMVVVTAPVGRPPVEAVVLRQALEAPA